MDTGFRTPLLDFFRRGEVARDIRLLAAQGAFAPRAHEQLGLLILLVADPDPEVAGAAEATLQAIPRASLQAFLARSDAPGEMRTFFAARGIEPSAAAAAADDQPIVDTSAAPERGNVTVHPSTPHEVLPPPPHPVSAPTATASASSGARRARGVVTPAEHRRRASRRGRIGMGPGVLRAALEAERLLLQFWEEDDAA